MREERLEINNKLESIETIERLGLNKLRECLFKKGDDNLILKFLKENPCLYYAIRDKSKVRGNFKLKVKKEDVLEEVKDYDLFTINVSSANYRDNQLLVGEIEICKSGEVYATLSTNKDYSVRDALAHPDFNIKTDIFDDDTLNKIPYFDEIFKYISDHELEDVIVEFSLFDTLVGINNENIVIYEIRTNY